MSEPIKIYKLCRYDMYGNETLIGYFKSHEAAVAYADKHYRDKYTRDQVSVSNPKGFLDD